MNFEESILRLKEICKALNDENTTLEEVARLYKEGMSLSQTCLEQIEEVKKDIADYSKEEA